MNDYLHADAVKIINESIKAVLPDAAVKKALEGKDFTERNGRVVLVAIGKAAWNMSKAAAEILKDNISAGICITKYGHVKGDIEGLVCYEAGHPVPDENTVMATKAAVELVKDLKRDDTVIFLISGGGSALFEMPLVTLSELQDITDQLLGCGADIKEINTIRKRLSAVKGGRFANICYPAKVEAVILSDVLGDAPDMIASGPVSVDTSTCEDALSIVKKYGLKLSKEVMEFLSRETPKSIENVHIQITGSVRELTRVAAESAQKLGYEPVILTDGLCCQAKDAGSFLGSIGASHAYKGHKCAFIVGGETVVNITGNGLGGRNQELSLAAALLIDGIRNVAVFSVGSDGTDGPTDAAGGYVDGDTAAELRDKGIDIYKILQNNDSYHALKEAEGLIITGPTGTNVNDVSVVLVD